MLKIYIFFEESFDFVVHINLLVPVVVGNHILHRVDLLLVLLVVLIDLLVLVVVGDLLLHGVELLLDDVLLLLFVLINLLVLVVVFTLLLYGVTPVLLFFEGCCFYLPYF